MALYEIVLCRRDEDEVRFTDHEPTVGSTLVIDYRPWTVVRAERPEHPIAETRYICLLRESSSA